jgi:hypothetical protein
MESEPERVVIGMDPQNGDYRSHGGRRPNLSTRAVS